MELMEIYRMTADKEYYDQLILNINNQFVTNIYNRYYILIKKAIKK